MTTPPTEQQLDEIEARHTAATKGPWKRSEDYSDIVAPDGSQLASYWLAADGEFIAHAPDDVRTLLDEVRRLQGQRRYLIEQLARKDARSGEADEKLREFLDEQELAARAFELPTPAWVEAVRAASAPLTAPLSPSQPSSVSESAQSPTGAPTGRVGDLPSTEDLASADDPTHLRWGLNDVLWSDDDSVIVLLSGPDREPYWLELDPERAAVLREDLAGPAEDPTPDDDFTGTQPCGHDDYHSPHEWADRPSVWCQGQSHDDDHATVEETAADGPEDI